MNIKGGALEFDIIANSGQLDRALEESKARVKGFSDATVEGGEQMDIAFKEAATQIGQAFKDIDVMAGVHKTAINSLEKEYSELGTAAAAAFSKGTAQGDREFRALQKKQTVVKQELTQRKELLREVEATADALAKEEQALNKTKDATEKNAQAQGMLRTQLMNAKNQLAEMEEAGQRGSVAYRELQREVGRLANAMGDANTQAKILSHDNAGLQGVISAVGGVAGAFSAAQGMIGLFSGESENLQKVMLKVQSLMAITMGLQQVANTINKDSYFTIVILGGIKEWWSKVVAKATVVETANTAGTVANTAAQKTQATVTASNITTKAADTVATGAQATAAKAGAFANLTLAGAFKILSTAIKSVPVMGWIVAGIAAIVSAVSIFSAKAREAKKAQKEFNEEVAKMAGKPITVINELSVAYSRLTDNMAAKEKFIDDNADKFKELGVQVRSVKDAENLLINNKDKFIQSLMLKAKAMATSELAAEKYKKALLIREEVATSDKSFVWKDKKKSEARGIEDEATALFQQSATLSEKQQTILKEIGASTEEITKGSIAAIEDSISKLRQKYKSAADDPERAELLKQIKDKEKELANITGEIGGGGSGGSSKKEDPFKKELDAKKKAYQEYFRWINAGLDKEAAVEFETLLESGTSYKEYLQSKLTALQNSEDKTAETLSKIRSLNNELAEETKETVLGEFEKSLQSELKSAQSIMEMLNILEEKRKTLKGDGSEIDTGKENVLDKAQEDIGAKAEQETKQLLSSYAGYLGEKIEFEAKYAEKSRLLNENLAKAKTEDDRQIALEALRGLEEDRKKYANQTGDLEYDKFLEQYKTFQQKQADIAEEYDAKIATAKANNNADLIAKLQEERDKALSSAALDELQNSGAWEQLLGNLDDLTTSQLEALIKKIEGQRALLGVDMDPADLDVILNKLQAAKNVVQERNPFKALRTALKDYKADESKANLTKVFTSVAASADLVKGSFDSVVGGLADMGLAGDETTQQLLGDISEMMGAASELATGIATGNPLAIIQGSIGLISSAFRVFNVRDRRAERAIKKHAEAVKDLESAYNALSWAVDKALGESVYDNQKALIKNLQQQQRHLNEMRKAEEGKKKTDKGKVKEYKQQYEELGRQIEDVIADIAASITQTTAKDLGNELADAIVEAFGKGEDAAKAFEEVSRKVMQNAVKNALKLQFLERPLQDAIAQLQKDMGFDEKGGGSFDGLTPGEQQRFKDAVANIGGNFAEAMKMYEDLFKEIDAAADPTTSLSGAIKGASQESIDLLAGQTNAVRVNQVESIEVMRNQLLHLVSIDAKVGVSNTYLKSIDSKISSNTSDPLRAVGITN